MLTVALVGADGAGKTTVAREVERTLDLPIRYLYMGVNLEASSLMLPSTRLMLALKRRRGGRGDMTAATFGARPAKARGAVAGLRSALRTGNWIAEEIFREAVSAYHHRRGRIVLFDRHFLADYHEHDVSHVDQARPIASRVHGWFLRRVFRPPDLLIVLDAPAEVLFARKPESSIEFLAARRLEYLRLRGSVPRFEVVDAERSLEEVVSKVSELIRDASRRKSRRLPTLNES